MTSSVLQVWAVSYTDERVQPMAAPAVEYDINDEPCEMSTVPGCRTAGKAPDILPEW